jgi:hypothetical protein
VLVGETPVQEAKREEAQGEVLRVSVVEAVQASLRCRPPFTPETYVPRVHFFAPSGCSVYEPRLPLYPDELVLRDPETHISSRPLVCNFICICT